MRKKIEAVGDDFTWCFQGPLYISLYGSAKEKNSKNIWKKIRKKGIVGDYIRWYSQGPLYISIYGR